MRLTQGTSRTVKAASLGRCAPPVGPAEDTAAQPAERPPTHPQIHTHTRHPPWSAETPPHTHSGLCWGEPSGRWEVP